MAKTPKAERQRQAAEEVLARLSPRISRMFVRYLTRYFGKHFHGFRIAKGGEAPAIPDGQGLVVFNNHASWWDALTMYYLGSTAFPGRSCFGPMDAEALEKYSFFKKLGVFGVERTASGTQGRRAM